MWTMQASIACLNMTRLTHSGSLAFAQAGHARELSLSARAFSGEEAYRMGLVSSTFDDQKALMNGALNIARGLAIKSPLALAGTKRVLLHQR